MESKKITFKCEVCEKEKTVYKSYGKHRFCSKKCERSVFGKRSKEIWDKLSKIERNKRMEKVRAGVVCLGKSLSNYHKQLRPTRIKNFITKMEKKSGIVTPVSTCVMISAHHEMLKDDPERLSTKFIQQMCGIDCKCKGDKK